jgi:hypothetical protein
MTNPSDPNLCPSCVGNRCDDCSHTGRASAYRFVVRETRARVNQIMARNGLVDPRDLDPHGRWIH